MFEWSTNPQLFWVQQSLRILFTSAILQAKASSSDLHTKPDNTIFAGDSQLTIVARSIISSAQARGVSQDLRLLVPTWSMISSGFFRKSGFIKSCMSSVIQPGKEDTLTLEFLDILWPWRCLRTESPVIITFFWRLGCICSRFVVDSVDTDWLVLCVVTSVGRHEGLLNLLLSLFAVGLSSFLTSTCASLIRRRGSKLFRVSVILERTDFWQRSAFPFSPRVSSTWTQHSLDFGCLLSTSLFSCIMMVDASLRESFSCSNDKTRLSKVKHFSSKSLIALSFLETEDNNVSHLFL